MTIYKDSKKFEPTKGSTNDAVFIKGYPSWQKPVCEKLNVLPGIKILERPPKLSVSDFDLIKHCEVSVFCFRKIPYENVSLIMASVLVQFPLEVLVFIDKKYEHRAIVEKVCECAGVTPVKELSKLGELAVKKFQYLKGLAKAEKETNLRMQREDEEIEKIKRNKIRKQKLRKPKGEEFYW